MAPKTWKTSSPAALVVSIFSSGLIQIDLTGAEPVDDLKQLLERAAEAIQTNDTQAVAGTGVIEQLGQAGTVKRTTENDILENTDGAGRF